MAVDHDLPSDPAIGPNSEAAPLIRHESETESAGQDDPDQAPKSSWELLILTLTMGG